MDQQHLQMCKQIDCAYNDRDYCTLTECKYYAVPKHTQEQPDQSIKEDSDKPKLTLVMPTLVPAVAWVRMFGSKKYSDPNSWKQVEKHRYVNAAYRHLMRYILDPGGVDSDSGLPHLWHCICDLSFIVEMEVEENGDDIFGPRRRTGSNQPGDKAECGDEAT